MVMPGKGILAADESSGTIKRGLTLLMLSQQKKIEEIIGKCFFKAKMQWKTIFLELYCLMKH